jgi:hypothetical protein
VKTKDAIPTGRVYLQSSELRWVQFDEKHSLLTTEFVAGGIYQYQAVPKAKYLALLAAESKGRYFNANIRTHPFERIS